MTGAVVIPGDCPRASPVYTRAVMPADPRRNQPEPPVTDLIDKRPNFYGFGGLDRSAHVREREGWLDELLERADTRLVLVWRTRSFVLEVEDAEEGLGPAFNGRSCAECHNIPAIGGISPMTEVRAGRRLAAG